jgi:hypothetical protein
MPLAIAGGFSVVRDESGILAELLPSRLGLGRPLSGHTYRHARERNDQHESLAQGLDEGAKWQVLTPFWNA